MPPKTGPRMKMSVAKKKARKTLAKKNKEAGVLKVIDEDKTIQTLDQYNLRPRLLFVTEYVSNGGNGTKAALSVYSCKDSATAASVASEALSNPKLKAALSDYLYNVAASAESATARVAHEMHAAATSSDRLKAANMLLKVHGKYKAAEGSGNKAGDVNFVVHLPGAGKPQVIDVEANVANVSEIE